jgi:hypothetical protein
MTKVKEGAEIASTNQFSDYLIKNNSNMTAFEKVEAEVR